MTQLNSRSRLTRDDLLAIRMFYNQFWIASTAKTLPPPQKKAQQRHRWYCKSRVRCPGDRCAILPKRPWKRCPRTSSWGRCSIDSRPYWPNNDTGETHAQNRESERKKKTTRKNVGIKRNRLLGISMLERLVVETLRRVTFANKARARRTLTEIDELFYRKRRGVELRVKVQHLADVAETLLRELHLVVRRNTWTWMDGGRRLGFPSTFSPARVAAPSRRWFPCLKSTANTVKLNLLQAGWTARGFLA